MSSDKMKEGRGNNMEKTDPGASKYGNFINYYSFHPAQERIEQLPGGIWTSLHSDSKYIALDIGCNSGDLSCALYTFLVSNAMPKKRLQISLLGIDIDPVLIERAREQNSESSQIKFECLDFLSDQRERLLCEYLQSLKKDRFDVTFCFSITMWIHLNHGDSGLVKFFKAVCDISDMIVVEPQQWKSYRNASRRLRRANAENCPLLSDLKYKGDVQTYIENILHDECKFDNVMITTENNWRRKLLIYRRKIET